MRTHFIPSSVALEFTDCLSIDIQLCSDRLYCQIVVLGIPSSCCHSVDSRPTLESLCHCLMVDPPNTSAPNTWYNTVVSDTVFFNRTQNLITYCRSMETTIFVARIATHYLTFSSFTHYLGFFLRTEQNIYTFPSPTHMVASSLS